MSKPLGIWVQAQELKARCAKAFLLGCLATIALVALLIASHQILVLQNSYNNGYRAGRNDAFSEARFCYGAELPLLVEAKTDASYPCEE